MYISMLAIAVGLSADAFAVTLSDMLCYGNLPLKKKMLLPVFFGLFQGIMPVIGFLVGELLGEVIQSIDHWVAFALLAFLGIKMIVESIKETKQKEEEKQCECQLSWGEMITQSFATSIDAMAVGITLAIVVNLPIYVSGSRYCGRNLFVVPFRRGYSLQIGQISEKQSGNSGRSHPRCHRNKNSD